jgi:hypothetical protein
MLTGLALKGGAYSWNAVPISDGDPEGKSFQTARPLTALQSASAQVSPHLNELVTAETHVPTRAYAAVGPWSPYSAPSRAVPSTPGRHLTQQLKPRTDKGPLAGLSSNEFADAMIDLFDSIDKRRRMRDERALHGPSEVIKQQQDDRDDDDVEAHGHTKVANDRRQVALDFMPLEQERMGAWLGWLTKKVQVPNDTSASYWHGLRAFLQRGVGRKKFDELNRHEKTCIRLLVQKIVGANA